MVEKLSSTKIQSATFFTPLLASKITIGAIFKSLVMILLFVYFSKNQNVNVASSLLFIFLIGHELLYAFSCRNIKKSVLNKNIFKNKKLDLGIGILIIIQVIILTTGLSKFFIVNGISIENIIITLTVLLVIFVIGEFVKPLYNKLFKDYVEVK